MSSEEKFWVTTFSIITAGIVVIIIAGLAYNAGKHKSILKATHCWQIAAIAGNNHTLALCKLGGKDEQE